MHLFDGFEIYLLFIGGLLVFIFMVYLVNVLKPEPEKEEPENKTPTKPNEVDLDKLETTLQFMMTYNIITAQEYNELLRKSLPYIKM